MKKRISAVSAVSQVVLAIAGLTALAVVPVPARAFDFQTQSGETAGNPAGQSLYQVQITTADVGESFPVSWVLPARTDIPQLSATAVFEVVELTSDRLVLDVRLSNETAGSFQAAITSFGFGITPTASDVALSVIEGNTATFETVVINQNQQNFPGGFKDINVCIYAANNCSGGAIMQGLQSGSSEDAFRLEIAGDFGATPSVLLASFPIKFQTEAGSFELAGAFTEVSIAEASNDSAMSESDDDDSDDDNDISESGDDDSESDDDDEEESDNDDAESDDLSESVRESVYREISAQSGVAISELRIVETRRETWSDGCLGLGGPADSCLQALVPGWRVIVESDAQTWVYRTDESGSVVVLDVAATETRTASVYTEARTETRTEERITEVTEVSGGTSGSVTAERTEVSVREAEFSETVRASVLQAIAQQYSGEVTNLEIVEVRRKVWSDGCLGLPSNNACTQALAPGWVVVARSQEQVWVYHTNETGSVVVLNESATATRRAQLIARQGTRVSFRDVASSYWASEFISELAALEIIEGFPDGTFRPDQPVTKAQFAAMLRRAFEVRDVRDAVSFRDVSSSYWAYTAIQEAYEMGFLSVDEDNEFNPTRSLTRADVLLAIATGLRLSSSNSVDEMLAYYTDVSTLSSAETRNLIAALTEQGIIVNYPETRLLSLNRVATRAEVAVFVYQALFSTGSVVEIDSPYVITASDSDGDDDDDDNDDDNNDFEERDDDDSTRQNCNQGIGNGAEGCDPGNSRPHGGSNDEGGRTPGGRN
jgi:hypothetical protein